tara:strand:- start:8540 stop:9271 length:732 start_codon:yes stop_codon:yes gene_type:complete
MKIIQVFGASLLLVVCLTAGAAEVVVPFIKYKWYKKNISFELFRVNPRGFFRSERAFDLIVDYVRDETGFTELGDEEFNALMLDDNYVQVRNCPTSERINTGAYKPPEFDWFPRDCRTGEQIVQVKVDGVWKDMFSLSCLNAVEDKTPVPPQVMQALVAPPAEKLVPYIPYNTTQQLSGDVVEGYSAPVLNSVQTQWCGPYGSSSNGLFIPNQPFVVPQQSGIQTRGVAYGVAPRAVDITQRP